MQDINNISGNIKLRLPKSLHLALNRQADLEGVSLNQLCLMYLSKGVSRNNLGAEEFNQRLEYISEYSKSDEELFENLNKLNEEVEALKPRLAQEIEFIKGGGKRNVENYIDILRAIYPIYSGNLLGEKLPMLKVPSAKISLIPQNDNLIPVGYEKVKQLVKDIYQNAVVAYGDYDYFVPQDSRLIDNTRIWSITINLCCNFSELEEKLLKIKDGLLDSAELKGFELKIKPCYLQVATRTLLK